MELSEAREHVLRGLKKAMEGVVGHKYEEVGVKQDGHKFTFTVGGRTYEAHTPEFDPELAPHLYEGVGRHMAFEISKEK